ncbi:Uncharacterised protein [Mycobacterium tuberculosis]|uniref:Uncharacterized protein n=1 Tax=Mycobacterium tuberculosis TaxID=1773 RepID=A0A655FVS3_MYCTX|nr:Uncharacterised protein [Mycobacterium tuberculosis]CNV85252.1 Uncharacterised protein [Mycobacterium tuberculosis]CNW27891.1 Uncharacterised protein [Mycobacterium tuberculosis]
MIRFVIALVPHQRSLATSTTAPSSRTDSILYGPDEGKRLRTSSWLRPGLRSHVEFHSRAICSTADTLLLSNAAVTSMCSCSAITCDGISDVAVNSWEWSTTLRSGMNDTRAFFCPAVHSMLAMST